VEPKGLRQPVGCERVPQTVIGQCASPAVLQAKDQGMLSELLFNDLADLARAIAGAEL
jgi:hypothetical protein